MKVCKRLSVAPATKICSLGTLTHMMHESVRLDIQK